MIGAARLRALRFRDPFRGLHRQSCTCRSLEGPLNESRFSGDAGKAHVALDALHAPSRAKRACFRANLGISRRIFITFSVALLRRPGNMLPRKSSYAHPPPKVRERSNTQKCVRGSLSGVRPIGRALGRYGKIDFVRGTDYTHPVPGRTINNKECV